MGQDTDNLDVRIDNEDHILLVTLSIECVDISRDSKRIVFGSEDRALIIRDIETKQPKLHLIGHTVACADISEDNKSCLQEKSWTEQLLN